MRTPVTGAPSIAALSGPISTAHSKSVHAMQEMAAVAPFKTRVEYERLAATNPKSQTELISSALSELGFPP